MIFLETDITMDFSATALKEALQKMKENEITEGIRLIISNGYMHRDILESIFDVRGRLDIPFEYSYAFPQDAWMLVEDNNKVIFYSRGA